MRFNGDMIQVVSWNVAGRDWWSGCDRDVDVLLLQEARRPASAPMFELVPSIDAVWRTAGGRRNWGTAIAAPSGRVGLRPHPLADEGDPAPGALLASRAGTLCLADVIRDGQIVVTVASMYAAWESAHSGNAIYADASAHRLLSDLSRLISTRKSHRIVAAGDLNILRGYGENGNEYWRRRYATVFDRAEAMGLRCVGPQTPNGRQAQPWPAELPRDSACPRTTRTARRQRRRLVSSTSCSLQSPSPIMSRRALLAGCTSGGRAIIAGSRLQPLSESDA
jgi:exonuclease III